MCDVPMWVGIDGGYDLVRGILWVFIYGGDLRSMRRYI